jgi:ferredoxin
VSIKLSFIHHDGSEKVADAEPGEKLTQVAYREGVYIKQSCGGTPSCTDCIVKIAPETPDSALNEIEHAEKALLGNVYFITRERLACQCIVNEDATVHIPEYKNKKGK